MKEIKEKLLRMQQELIADMEAEHNRSVSSVTNEIGDSIDHASEERERELHQLFSDRDRLKLQQIKQALERIEEETYGFCEECDEQIGKKRLLAMPFTQLCIQCKTEEEKMKGRNLFQEGADTNFGTIEANEMDS